MWDQLGAHTVRVPSRSQGHDELEELQPAFQRLAERAPGEPAPEALHLLHRGRGEG